MKCLLTATLAVVTLVFTAADIEAGLVHTYNLSTGAFVATSPATMANGPLAGTEATQNLLGYAHNGTLGLSAYDSSGAEYIYRTVAGTSVGSLGSTLSGGPLAGQSATNPTGGTYLDYANNNAVHITAYVVGSSVETYVNHVHNNTLSGTLIGGSLAGESMIAPTSGALLGYYNNNAIHGLVYGITTTSTIEVYNGATDTFVASFATKLIGGPLDGSDPYRLNSMIYHGFGRQGSGSLFALVEVVPEPNTGLLLSVGLVGLVARRRRRK